MVYVKRTVTEYVSAECMFVNVDRTAVMRRDGYCSLQLKTLSCQRPMSGFLVTAELASHFNWSHSSL